VPRKPIDKLGPGFNHGFSGSKDAKSSKGAQKRADGELYKRPEPNPFTPEWQEGYDDGLEDRPYNPLAAGGKPQNYRDGYNAGGFDREEIDRMGSSNA
jgi:hypothetical protein